MTDEAVNFLRMLMIIWIWLIIIFILILTSASILILITFSIMLSITASVMILITVKILKVIILQRKRIRLISERLLTSRASNWFRFEFRIRLKSKSLIRVYNDYWSDMFNIFEDLNDKVCHLLFNFKLNVKKIHHDLVQIYMNEMFENSKSLIF